MTSTPGASFPIQVLKNGASWLVQRGVVLSGSRKATLPDGVHAAPDAGASLAGAADAGAADAGAAVAGAAVAGAADGEAAPLLHAASSSAIVTPVTISW
jgi:hypothetical protein